MSSLSGEASIAAGGEVFAYTIAAARHTGGDIAAVNGDFRAADKARLIRREEQHQIGTFLWCALSMHRDRDAGGTGESIAATAVEPGIGNLSGVDRIDPDVPLRKLQHRRFGQPAQPPLAGSVSGVVMQIG